MLRVYKWTGILEKVITLLSSLMRKWKAILKTWKDGEKKYQHKMTAIWPLDFVYLKSQYINYSKNPQDTVWGNQGREM